MVDSQNLANHRMAGMVPSCGLVVRPPRKFCRNTGITNEKEVINRKTIQGSEVTSEGENNQRIYMKVPDRRKYAAPSLRMGEILAGQHKEQGASRGQRHLRTKIAESRLETTPSTREPPELTRLHTSAAIQEKE